MSGKDDRKLSAKELIHIISSHEEKTEEFTQDQLYHLTETYLNQQELLNKNFRYYLA